MNVFDFDGTLYRGDSSVDFYFYCLFRYPWIALCLPYQVLFIIIYKYGFCSKEMEKSAFFSFLRLIPNPKGIVEQFWNKYIKRITDWYYHIQRKDDVIISASPEFLIFQACKMLGVKNVIASKVDISTGLFLGKNCYGEEKVKRFKGCFPKEDVSAFYSDSRTDSPMALIAKKAYFVKKYTIISNW